MEEHLTPTEVPILTLDCVDSWNRLTDAEKKYAHYIAKAAWEGAYITFEQTSNESLAILELFQTLFHSFNLQTLRSKCQSLTDDEFNQFSNYVTYFYGNMGNYKSFGDQKFIPRLPREKFTSLISSLESKEITDLYNKCVDKMYSLAENEKEMGLDGQGVSSFYSEGITRAEIQVVQDWMSANKIEGYNTRLFKVADKVYELRLASAEAKPAVEHEHAGIKIRVVHGDFSKYLKHVADNLEHAIEFAANDHQRGMLKYYVKHFRGGDVEDHKEAQRHWIKDLGPVVESNIGFIETYRDPFGVRAEWEGFVSVVNKEMSAKFGRLVDNAEKYLKDMPWPCEYHKDTFMKPDFTSLEVVAFATSGIPAGINLPNYDDVRHVLGFKNVSLGNVLRAAKMDERVTFLGDADQEPFKNLLNKAFEVQVGIHELLGHGSGKIFTEDEKGQLNFDKNTINPVTGKPVATWYKPGTNYDSTFSSLGSAMEECRAECCGIYLCLNRDLLSLFSYTGNDAEDILYVNWLNMVRAGVLGLEFYSPQTSKWRQAHMQARYAILSVLREAGQGLVSIKLNGAGDDFEISLDRSKIETVGKEAIGKFLMKINVYKALADVESATQMFNVYSGVGDLELKLRDIVMAKKKPRRVFVQPHTHIEGDKAVLKEFAPTHDGMIQSFITRFSK
jgi:dipeptidyl-peptidase-3